MELPSIGGVNNDGQRVVWSSLRASMLVVMASVIFNILYTIGAKVADPFTMRIVYFGSTVENMYSPILYLLLFPLDRAALMRLIQRMRLRMC